MRSLCPGRLLLLALTLATALVCAGCPELNRQPDRSVGPLFSVDDPAGRDAATTSAGDEPTPGRTQFVISEEGGLPDQSRRAH
jgi:hypothetical protein